MPALIDSLIPGTDKRFRVFRGSWWASRRITPWSPEPRRIIEDRTRY